MENILSVEKRGIKYGRLLTLSFSHMINDLYMNQLQVMLPFFVLAGLSVSRGAFLISAFTITSSLVQPAFGLIADRKNRFWMVYSGTLWMALLLGITGLIQNYYLLIIAASLAGLGTAAFHPQASAMAAACSVERKNFSQAVFIASGNVGWALTPLLFAPLAQNFGLGVTPVFIIPGLLAAAMLWISVKGIPVSAKKESSTSIFASLKKDKGELLKIMLVVALRSLTYFSMIAFLPLYLKERNISLVSGSRLVFLMLFAGSIGGLTGGFIADKHKRKTVIAVSLIAASPLFYLFTIFGGIIGYIMLALAGAFLLASFSVTVTAAQKIIEKNAAFASGLTLGFGTGIGGLGVSLIGLLAESQGITTAINLLVWFPIAGGVLGFLMREKE